MSQTWTTAQAAFIVEKPIDALQKTLERAPVKPRVAAAKPKVGRPFPKVTAKKVMRTARVRDADTFLPSRE